MGDLAGLRCIQSALGSVNAACGYSLFGAQEGELLDCVGSDALHVYDYGVGIGAVVSGQSRRESRIGVRHGVPALDGRGLGRYGGFIFEESDKKETEK